VLAPLVKGFMQWAAWSAAALALNLFLTLPAGAAVPGSPCSGMHASPPLAARPDFSAHAPPASAVVRADPGAVLAAATPGGIDAAGLTPGTFASLALLPTAKIAYAVVPSQPGDAASYGGMFGLTIAEAGTYRFLLAASGSVAVVRDSQTIASTSHPGPPCSAIREMVDFRLRPGRHIVEIAGSSQPTVPLRIILLTGR
jgi:hypothetical protein